MKECAKEKLVDTLNLPEELKGLSLKELKQVGEEIRNIMIETLTQLAVILQLIWAWWN